MNVKISDLKPMSEAPRWDRYNGDVETVMALLKGHPNVSEHYYWMEVFFNRKYMKFCPVLFSEEIIEDCVLVGFIDTPIIIEDGASEIDEDVPQ